MTSDFVTRQAMIFDAYVMGDIDLVRPLGLAGIRSVVACSPGNAVLYSRYVCKALSWEDSWDNTEAGAKHRLEMMLHLGSAQPRPPVLFYESDEELLFVSRYRKQLSQAFRFVVPDEALVETLVNKAKFQELAERLSLPIPPTTRSYPPFDDIETLVLQFPVIVKPIQDRGSWAAGGGGKARLAKSAEALRELRPELQKSNTAVLIQMSIPGPESQIESYHVYVDHLGKIAADFMGRKIRTFPTMYGHSTAIETTDAQDVREIGREIVRKLNLRGVAKLDFKRDPDGKLYLLEVNPRFNLWHHLGAVAGVNLPAFVYADLRGLPRPMSCAARAGVRWSRLWKDFHAAQASGSTIAAWLWWALRCEVKSDMTWDDPVPLLRRVLSMIRLQRRVGCES